MERGCFPVCDVVVVVFVWDGFSHQVGTLPPTHIRGRECSPRSSIIRALQLYPPGKVYVMRFISEMQERMLGHCTSAGKFGAPLRVIGFCKTDAVLMRIIADRL